LAFANARDFGSASPTASAHSPTRLLIGAQPVSIQARYDEDELDSQSKRKTGAPFYVLLAGGRSMNFTTAFLIVAWYASNIGVLLLNKYLLSVYGFKYPVFLTLCHMVACTLLGVALNYSNIVPCQRVSTASQLRKIGLLAFVFCCSIVCGNISLRYLPVSFNQAIGSTGPFFTAVMAYIISAKSESRETYLSLVPVVIGIVVASGAEPLFDLTGFIACVSATAARALKSVLQDKLLSSDTEKLNSVSLLLYMAPMACVLLIVAAHFLEPGIYSIAYHKMSKSPDFVLFLALNCFTAYFVNVTNFLVTKHTSALTLQVLGNAKGIVATIVSILVFQNPVTATGMAGYSITIFGCILYNEARKREKNKVRRSGMQTTLGGGDGGGGGDLELGTKSASLGSR